MANTEDTAPTTSRSQMAIHEGQVAYIESEKGVDLSKLSPAEVIAHAYATRVAWRQTDDYKAIRASAAESRAADAEARKAAAAERKAAKAKAEKASKPAAKKATKAPAKKATGAKRATKATKATAEADPFA